MKRRRFIRNMVATTTAVSSAFAATKVLGANERVRLGLIGCGGRGRFVARHLRDVPNVEFVAVCDLYPPRRAEAKQWAGGECADYADFRKLLDRPDVDAVLVATPDHWHAIPTVLACQAGKDVYVEKPLGHNIREGQAMVKAARNHNRVVQTGTQHRSAPHWEVIRQMVAGGELGKVRYVRAWNYSNMLPRGIGKKPDSQPPEGLDWDFYLGPAPWVPFNPNRFLANYRWFLDYSGGIITDFGAHRLDSMHQVMGADAPEVVSASGHLYDVDDGGDVPDILQVTYEYPGFTASYEACRLNGYGFGGRTPGRRYYGARDVHDCPNGLIFYGSNGTLVADRVGFEIFPEPSGQSRGSNAGDQSAYRMERKEMSVPDATPAHAKNFIDCVRSRNKPAGDIEVGHKASTACHLGNIAFRTGQKFRWDGLKEEIVGAPEAAALLGRNARKPWDLI